MDETESYLSKESEKQLETWGKTTKAIQRKESSSGALPVLRTSPTRSKTPLGQENKNKFIRKADYLINVSRDRAEAKDRKRGDEEKYSGSLYESFVEEDLKRVEQQLAIPKKDAKLIWAKLKETDIVPCLPDIFMKIACTDEIAPYGARLVSITFQNYYGV